ncbi:DNA repair protein rhp54 [Hordeum vulgare]|nr:DNA repair protein rhp54 [Hordeum vulgare]
MTQPIPCFHVYLQTSRLSRECSLKVSVMVPSTPAPVHIDLNAISLAGGSSSGGVRKCVREMPADMLSGTRNLFDGMPADAHNERANRFMQSIIFEGVAAAAGGAKAAGYDSEETQS